METKEYRLTDICDFQGGTQPPKEEWINEPREGYVRMLQIRDFTQGKAKHIEYVKDKTKLNKCNEDDILIGRYGASVGKILTGLAGAYNVAIIKTIPNKEILSKKYLYFVLTGTAFQNFIAAIGSRAAQAGFNKDDLSKYKLHLPSLQHQNQIADVLEKAKSLIFQRKQGIDLLNLYLRNTFLKMFGDPMKNEKGWKRLILKTVCEKITDGTHFSPPIVENGKPYITAKHVRENKIDFWANPWFISDEQHKEIYKRCDPKQGDILYIKDGATTGFAAINKYEFEFSMLSSLALLRTKKELCLSEYLCSWLNNPRVKESILKMMSGGAIQRLTLTKINKISILLPPIELQKQFANILEKIEILKEQYHKSFYQLEKLYDSLSQKAFTGKLDIITTTYLTATLKIEPKISAEVQVINKVNNEIETFHNSLPHSGASSEVDNKLRQLETELKLSGEVAFDEDYFKYKIVKTKFNDGAFTFQQLWQEITSFPFNKTPEYDDVSTILFKWLDEDDPFIKQSFNKDNKQIELQLNETAKA